MITKISFFITLLAVALIGVTTAQARPLDGISTTSYEVRNKEEKKEWILPERCKDKQAKILFKAGFNKPGMIRGAWAITWRESKHQALDESSPWYTGALGTWQIQTSAWSGKSWWSREAMLDKYQQSVIVRKHFLEKGLMYHWGYSYSWKKDTWYEDAGMYYELWGSDLTYAWVIEPFNTGWSLFPDKCTPVKK